MAKMCEQVLDEVEENLILEMENIRLWQYRFKMATEQASEHPPHGGNSL
jgi:hypothetical protein